MIGARLIKQGCLFVFGLLILSVTSVPSYAKDELVMAWQAMPKTIDPRFAVGANSWGMNLQLIYGSLVELDYNLKASPALAESWETPTSTSYVFHLRKNAKFSNGDALTAEDVKFTFDTLMDPETKSPFIGIKNTISSVEVIDANTIRFGSPEGMPEYTYFQSLFVPIFQKNTSADAPLLGAGPFQLTSQNASEIVLEANPHFYGTKPGMARVVFKVIKDDNTRFLKFQKGSVDYAFNAVPANKLKQFTKGSLKKNYDVLEGPGLNYQYLGFNTEHPILKHKAVRQAFAHAINRDELVQYLMDNRAVKADSVLTPENDFYAANLPQYEFNPEKAKELLDQAGFPMKDGKRFSLVYKTSENKLRVRLGRIIKEQLKQVGIDIEVRAFEWGTFFGDVKKGNFDIYSLAWRGISDPDFFYEAFHSSKFPPGRNRVRYVNPEMDQLVERARTESNVAERKKLYREVQELLTEEMPYLSLWYANNVAVISKAVKGYRLHPNSPFQSVKDLH